MTKAQQRISRVLWLVLIILLASFTLFPLSQISIEKTTLVLCGSMIGWFGGISFVFSFLSKVEE